MEPGAIHCSLAFFAWRFSLSDLPDFFEAVLRGDLSDMSASFPSCDRTPIFTSPERTEEGPGLLPTPGRWTPGWFHQSDQGWSVVPSRSKMVLAGGLSVATRQVEWGFCRLRQAAHTPGSGRPREGLVAPGCANPHPPVSDMICLLPYAVWAKLQ